MVWFICDSCGDSIKKPKVPQHLNQCNACSLTCVDCSRTFDRRSYAAHTTCVTESQKYAEGATKPGGFASKGFFEAGGKPAAAASAADPAADEFLSKRPPWKCSVCNVSCTSQDTLHAHASGKKHIRRAQAARGAISKCTGAAAQQSSQPSAVGSLTNGAHPSQAEPDAAAGAQPLAAAIPPDSSAAAAPAANGTGEQGHLRKPKWKAIAAKLLRANGGVLKLKKLQSSALKSVQLPGNPSKAALRADMLAKVCGKAAEDDIHLWQASSRFIVGEDVVKLAR